MDNTGVNDSYQHLNVSSDYEGQHGIYVVWSCGNEATHFFIKGLKNYVKPQIHKENVTKV